MENRNIDTNCNRNNQQCSSSRELELERKLMKESTRLDDADTYNMPYEKAILINLKQEEMYNKWKLLKGIREAREKMNDKENNEKQILEDISKEQETKKRIK